MMTLLVEKCENCRFWLEGKTKADVFDEVGGMCRRYVTQGPTIIGASSSWQVFPPAPPHQWCGDYRPSSEPQIGAAKIAA